MDNIKKFEDFLGKMQGLLDNAKKQGHIIIRVEDLEKAFPELKESEDEKVREDIISLINEFWEKIGSINPEYSSRSRMLAWLEKQGEQNPAWSKEDDGMLDTMEGWLDTLCEYLKDSSSEYIPDVESCMNWLKALKQRIGGEQ